MEGDPVVARLQVHLCFGTVLGFAALLGLTWWSGPPTASAQQTTDPLAALKAKFARPTFVPNPAGNPPTAAKVALGKRLFEDPELSATGTIACRSCHDPKLAFTDGESTGKGVTGKPLVRHTPSLWNVAWSPLLFWDGRASSLEDQVRFPVEHPDEMGSSLENGVARLSRHDSYVQAFAQAFPQDRQISPGNIAKALAAYERTLVSPPTRFDRWVAGDAAALTPSEVNGFAIFTGKGRCINCHTGFAFTDHGFYDIGLPSEDQGRGPIVGLPVATHAFKVPTLARARVDRALHARRLARHPRRRGARLRDGRRRAPDASQGPARQPAARRSGARRSHRLPREPVERDAAAALDRALGERRPRRRGPRRHATPQSSAKATSCSRRSTSCSRPAGRSPFSTTTRAPTTCASSTRASISTPEPKSRARP